ncbi:MAG: EAL domain-containing protein [Actinomycetes bacterium]
MGLRDGAMQEPVTASTVPEQRLAEAQRIARVGSWSWDVLSDSVTWSDQLFRNYGLEARTGPASVAAYLERVHPSDRERVERAIAGTIATLTPYEHEYRIVHPDGEVRVMHARGEVTQRSGDTVLQLTGYCQDVTERWTAEEKRRHAQRELAGHQMVLARIARGEPLKATLDLLCREIEASYPGTLCSVLMVSGDGEVLRLVAAPSLNSSVRARIDRLRIVEGKSVCGSAAARNRSVIVEDTMVDSLTEEFSDLVTEQGLRSVWSQPLHDASGHVVGTFAIYRTVPHRPDVLEQRAVAAAVSLAALALQRDQHIARLEAAARFDSLTGLVNRSRFLSDLSDRLLTREHRPAVLFLDLDGFKWINDGLGHAEGDRILQAIADRLRSVVDKGTIVARLGGDEFALLVADADTDTVEDLAQLIESAMAAPFSLHGGEFFFSISIGIAFSTPSTDAEGLMRDADAAMYVAKAMAGSAHCTFTPRLRDHMTRRLALEADLRRAIERDEFVMHYQPTVDLRTRTWAGVESLVRWQHPTMGLVAPDSFIPLAEETGLIVPLGSHIFNRVMKMAVELGEELPPTGMALNVSARQLCDPSFVTNLVTALEHHGLPPHSLAIEITETALIENLETAHAALSQLSRLGMRLIVDDFGCGYSSISRLREFPITAMKIDKSLCVDLGKDKASDNIVESIVNLAHALKLSVVMEGIETSLAATTSRNVGADLGQGYFFTRPCPAEQLAGILTQRPAF